MAADLRRHDKGSQLCSRSPTTITACAMPSTDDQLKYDVILKGTYGGLLSGNPARDAWVHRKAEEMQALMVMDAIRDASFGAVVLADGPLERDAVFHLRYGVAHRTKFIWIALRRLLAVAPPERTEPVSLEDVETLASDLNVVYLNIRGALDNFAWTIRAQNPSAAAAELRDQHMDLFGQRFLNAIGDESLREALEPFRPWYVDLKGRRDPAAHRIPLSVPPTILDEVTQQEYAEIERQHAAATAKALAATRQGLDESPDRPLDLATAEKIGVLFDEAHAIHAKRQQIGRFPGLFAHHPDKAAMPIYPTVPEDIRNLIAIARGMTTIIERQVKPPARNGSPT